MRPGSNPSDLQLLFTGQDSLKVDLWGNLKVYYNGQYYILPQAVAYQVGTGNSIIPVNWAATYSLVSGGGVVKFNFSTYNPALPLVFQVGALPSTAPPNTENLCWSTYLGGTNGDQVNASAIDAAGNFFVTGYSLSDFYTIPNNPGTAFINCGQVIILAFFDPNYHLQWLTYYGASGTDQQANAVVTRGSGANERVYIAGYTTGANLYPKVEAGAYNLQTVSTGYYRRAILAKFDLQGNILWGTYFGNGESEIRGIDVDGTGRLHIVGQHNAVNVPLYPLAGATNLAFTGLTDLLVARFNTSDNINWSSVYGAGYGYSIRCTSDGGFIVSGRQGAGIPMPDQGGGAYHVGNAGGGDCTLLKFNSSAWFTHATFYGGNHDWDFPAMNSLALTPSGGVYLVGNTYSTSGFPLVGAPGTVDGLNTGKDGFIAYFTPALHLEWSTYVNATLDAVATDANGNVFVSGTTLYNEAATLPLMNAPGYYNQGGLEGSHDGVLLGFHGNHQQFYGSYFGGPEGSYPDEVTTMKWRNNRLYFGGFTTKQQDVTSFFPLYNPGLPAYFDGTYQYVPGQLGLNQNYQDAFVSVICIGSGVGIDEVDDAHPNQFTIGPDEGGQRALFGLPDGHYAVALFDATGRIVATEAVTSTSGHARMDARTAASGLYLVRVTSGEYLGTARFINAQ
ncbi:MAG: T9SS type A sorting domain-containing protein [Bacteroidetes bacterium]|nr:T9SS type A sorting domain-containing protein [Bacteroidota bacterium]